MVALVAVVIGAILGGGWADSSFGAVIGALLGWLWLRSLRQSRELTALREALEAVTSGAPRPDSAPLAADVPVPRPSAADREAPPPTDALPLAPAPSAIDTAARPSTSPPTAAPPPRPPGLVARLQAWLLGGNTIVKAGVGILFIGLAFLAKYASEQVTLPVEWRLAGVGGVAVALLGLGWRLRRTRPGYAQVLQGGAVAVMYLTLFTSFKLYGVLAAGPVFAMMAAVAAFAAALAVLQDARSLAVIGALGGFATPLIVSSGGGNQLALFSYYLLLDLGIAAVAWFRTWRSLNLIGFGFTFVVATTWGVLSYDPSHYASSQAFLIAFFLLFAAILLMPMRRPLAEGVAGRIDALVPGSLLFGLPTITFVLQHGLVRDTPFGTALSALVLAGFYVVLATQLRRRPAAGAGVTFDGCLAIAIVFLTLVIPFAVDARSTAGAWALEAAALVWLGFRQARRVPRAFGYLLFLASVTAMTTAHDDGGPATWINCLLAGAGALIAAWAVHRHADRTSPPAFARSEPVIGGLLIALGTLWLASGAAWQIDRAVPNGFKLAACLVALGAIAALYGVLSRRFDWPGIAVPALAQAPLLLVLAGVHGVLHDSPLANGGWWAWPLAIASHASLLRNARWSAGGASVMHATGVIVLAVLGAFAGRALTVDWGDVDSAWPWLGWMLLPAPLLLGLLRPAVERLWPVRAAPTAYRRWAAGLLALGALLWSVVANVASDGSAQPLPHLPLLNPLDLGVALALFAAWEWWRSEPARGWLGGRPAMPIALFGTAFFVWLNAMLVRGFHHYGGVPYRFDDWVASLAVQTGITLLWTTSALVLMWLSARRRLRLPWLVGAALLAAVVVKLLLVDLSGSGTVARIVSFIGVGALMLVIGYVAPLPTAAARPADEEARDATV